MDAMEWPPTFDGAYAPPVGEEYWDRRAETMPPEEREAVVLRKLSRQLRYAQENSEFYKELWRDASVDPANIHSLDDLCRLPILTKDHLRREQEAHPPFGRYLCIPPDQITRIQGTSGTTGNPTIFGIGRGDWDRIAEAHARILWAAGLRPDDTVIIAAVFSAYIGSWGALLGAERLGAKCFPFGAGAPQQTERAVDWIAMLKPTALYGTPSYALYLASTARQMGVDPLTDFNFRLMFFSGEPGASIPSTRREIEETFGCNVVDQGSMAEMTPWMTNSGCRFMKRGMHLWTDIVYTEIVDPDTHEPVPPGGEGVPVYTHLERTSQPMVRYWSGDLARWTDDRCECGRTYPNAAGGTRRTCRRHDNRARAGHLPLQDRGRPAGYAGVRRGVPAGRRTGARPDGLADRPRRGRGQRLRLGPRSSRRFANELRRAVGVGLSVELRPPGEFERTQFKARRIIDRRRS